METLNKEYLNRFKKILITGCQRSGTQLVTDVVQYELNCPKINEREYNVYDIGILMDLVKDKEQVAIHAPALSSKLEFLAMKNLFTKDDLIIWVKRNKEDVFSSIKRIGWNELVERASYFKCLNGSELDIYDLKNLYWEVQKAVLEENNSSYLEVQYEDLKDHKLWIPKEKRTP